MKGTFLLTLAVLGVYESHGANLDFVQPTHLTLTQYAELQCSKNDTTMLITFKLFTESDTVQAVFTRGFSDSTVNSIGAFDNIMGSDNGITGDGTPANPFTFVLEASCASSPPTIVGALETSALLEALAPTGVGIKVMSKSLYQVGIDDGLTFPEDVEYNATCDCTDAGSVILTTNATTVNGNNEEPLEFVSEGGALLVYIDTLDVPVNFIDIGNLMYLVIELAPGSAATGAFVYDCYICNDAACTSNLLIIGPDGCPIYNYFGAFYHDDVQNLTRTPAFRAPQLNSLPSTYFQCSAQFCFSPGDLRCDDFCAYNTAGRKKRDAPKTETEQISTTEIMVMRKKGQRGVLIQIGQDGQPVFVEVGETKSDALVPEGEVVGLVAAVVVLAGLLFVGVILAVVVFFCISRRRDGREKVLN